jgi:cold shock CspA family protein
MRISGTLKFYNAAKGFGVLEDDSKGRGKQAAE